MPVLLVDAHFTVVEAALKGYMKWRSVHGSKLQQDVPTPFSNLNRLYADFL
jgi:exportin-5